MKVSQIMTATVAAFAAQIAYSGVASADQPKDLPAQVTEQLTKSKEELAAKGLPLKLVSYSAAAPLDNDAAVRSVKAQMVDEGAIVVQYDGEQASSFKLGTIGERMKAFRAGQEGENVVANIQSMAFPTIKAGQKTLDVTWEGQGKKFQTKLIYDDKGIVYDNMLSNIAFVEGAPEPSAAPPKAGEAAGAAADAKRGRNWSTRFRDVTIKWVWGGTRGKVTMDHYVVTCDGWRSFCDDGGQSNAWMSLGKADGKTRRHALKKHISKLAWGYGWATPTASFKISWNAQKASFSASVSGVGSSGKGAGIHTID